MRERGFFHGKESWEIHIHTYPTYPTNQVVCLRPLQKKGKPVCLLFYCTFYYSPRNEECLLPKDSGNCMAAFLKYYYDWQQGECLKFYYGGCQGNENRFESLDECEKRCSSKSLIFKFPSRQNCGKSSGEECILDYMALHIECRFNKKSLLQCYFLVFLPAGSNVSNDEL